MTQGEHNESVLKRLELLEQRVLHIFKKAKVMLPMTPKTVTRVAAMKPVFPPSNTQKTVSLKPLSSHPILDALKVQVPTQ